MSKNANLLLRRINPYIKQFDVSMSDGLKSIPKNYTLSEKKQSYIIYWTLINQIL